MDQKKINKEVLSRLSKLENAVFGGRKTIRAKEGVKSLADHVIALRERGIFKNLLIPQEVHKKLKSAYPCSLDRVVTVLGRLQRRKQLRKTIKLVDKRKYNAYVW